MNAVIGGSARVPDGSGVGGVLTRQRTRRPVLGRMSVFVIGLVLGGIIGACAVILAGPVVNELHSTAFASAPPILAPAAPHAPATPAAPVQAAAAAPMPPQALHIAAGRPVVIGVFGDSMGDGLWAGLYRQLRDGRNFEVVRFSRAATGLARYDYVDVHAQAVAQLAERHIDIAVVMVGANDEQGILEGGQAYAFGTPHWRAIYERRIDELVRLFREHGAAVYWVGLPKMRRAGYDERAQLLNAIYEARARANGAPFVPTVPVSVDASGRYNDYLSDGSRPKLMRAKDGIHMTMAGYLRIAEPVSSLIRADVGRALAAHQNRTAEADPVTSAGDQTAEQ